MNNVNPETGVRFGYIATNLLNPDLVHELLYVHGTDETYKQACEEAKAGYIKDFNDAEDECEIAADEIDRNMVEADREEFITKRMRSEHGIDTEEYDAESWAEFKLEEFSDTHSADEPVTTGVHEGVTYRTSWLGGALNLWVFKGPEGFCRSLCSICVPNAANLDQGFLLEEEAGTEDNPHPDIEDYPYPCYVVPRDWLAESDKQLKLGV